MTINIGNNNPRVSYTATSGQTVFTIPFDFFEESDISVYINGTEKTVVTHYSVDVDNDGNFLETITLVDGASSGDKIAIVRDVSLQRTTDFTAGAAINRDALNEQLDIITAQIADIDDRVSRAIQLNDHEVASSITLPAKDDRKGKVLGFNETTGDVQSGPTFSDIQSLGDISADIATLADIEDGTDATDAIQTAASISSNITTVSGISSDVSAVAGISSDVTTVASDSTDINTVATNISSVNTVANNINDVVAVANDLNEAVSEVATVADDLNEAVSEIDTVASSISNVDTVGSNITDVNTVAGISSDVTTVAGISADTTTVSGISGNVTTVAGISSDVTAVAADATDIGTVSTNITNVNSVANNSTNINSVAGNSTNINTVAGDSANIGTVAGISTDVSTVAGNNANITTVAGISSDVTTVASNDTNITSVATNSTNINTTATNISDVNSVAGISSDVTTVAGISSDTTTVAGISGNVTTVAGISSDVTAVAADATDIGTVATDISNVNAVAGNATNINAVAGNATNINAVAADAADIGTVSGISANVTTVAGLSSSVSALALISSDITTVAGISSSVTTVAGDTVNIGTIATNLNGSDTIGTVANSISNVNTVSSSISNVNTVATNISSVNDFADKYRIGANDPTTNNDEGDLFYNTTTDTLKVYTGTAWEQGVTAGSGFLPLGGGTMTGAITLSGAPTANLHAATKAYVDSEISAIVDSAPSTLDTLNELAAALGDDANFSTTVTNSIATKLPLAGGTMTGAITFASGQTFDGRDVSADGTKLAGIESGATADQTASEILTAIKTVDGSGSGLDADTLDGNHASAFLTGNQTITLTGDVSGSGTTSINVTVANDSHTHDGRYYTETEADARFLGISAKAADANLLDGIDSGSFVRSDASDTLTGATYTLSNATDQKIILSGASNPYIRFKEGTTDRAYIQWRAGSDDLLIRNQQTQLFDFRGNSGVSLRLRDNDDNIRGYVHANTSNNVGFLDAGSNWAIRHINDQGTYFYTDNQTEEFKVGRDIVSGGYGTVETRTTRNSYGGYSINGQWVFMSSGAGLSGIYNDTNDEWAALFRQNAEVELFYNGTVQFETGSAGVSTGGGMRIGAFGNPHNTNGLEVTGTGEEKIVLSGATNPYIRFQEGSTDRAYIQWNASNDALRFHNQQSDFFDFRPHDTGGAVNIRLRGSDDDTWGSVYASENGGNHSIGFLDGDGNWAYRHNKDVDHAWVINTVTEMSLNTSELNLSGNNINNVSNMYVGSTIYHYGDTDTYINFGTDLMYIYTGNVPRVTVNNSGVRLGDNGNGYFQPVTGSYGSIQIDGGAHNGYEGYSIGGRAVFMHNNNTSTGIFNDVNNHWLFLGQHNGYTRMYYNGTHVIETTSTGVTVVGDLNSTSDIRYKKNIETIDSALEKVQSLRGVTFDWDNDAFEENENTKKPNFTERATGVIAQDVEKVLPEAVRENKDGFKNVAYGNMVGLLIEAIKEQQEQIDALKAQLNG